MNDAAMSALPPQPPGIAEWEDLLVRLEIMPRALRGTLDGLARGTEVDRIIDEMVEREEEAGRWLETAATGEAPTGLPGRHSPAIRTAMEWFEALRLRNFAMVQRRGVEVWGWSAKSAQGAEVTVYQLLSSLVLSDAEALAALRATKGAIRAQVGAC